jgi:hypothetical protein
LVIECQGEKLAAQGLHLGTEIATRAKTLFPKKAIVLIGTSTLIQLPTVLGEILETNGHFRSVLLVGHSNADSLQLSTDDEGFYPWAVVAQWLAPFQPEFLFFAACRAGQSFPVRELFSAIPSLRQVYASPVALYRDQADPLPTLILQLLANRKIDVTAFRILQGANYLGSGGIIYRWTRADFRPGKLLQNVAYSFGAEVLSALHQRRA